MESEKLTILTVSFSDLVLLTPHTGFYIWLTFYLH